MKRPSRLDYAYAVGRAKALDIHLIPRAVFLEAAEAGDPTAALKVLHDAGKYSEDLLRVANSDGLDAILGEEEDLLKRVMSELLPERDVLEIFLSDRVPGEAFVLSHGIPYPFIRNYIRHRLDLANVKMFFRVRYLGQPKERFEERAFDGGFIETPFFRRTFDIPLIEAVRLVPYPDYRGLWERGARALVERETFIVLEREIEDFLMNYLRGAKQIVFGPEPVFAYGLARMREIGLIRLVGVGKINGVPAGLIKERISETYG